MSIPLLEYPISTQNQRVEGFEVVLGEEQPRVYTTENLPSAVEMDEIIWAAYRQIFSEHQILKYHRQSSLETQLRFGQLKIKDFIRGLATCDTFKKLNYEVNNNYRFAELCVQRILGRDVYSEKEKIAWSIVIVNQGVEGFIDTLVDSEEYEENFGESTVPYQRRRIIPQRSKGETPFNLKTPRYNETFRDKMGMRQFVWQNSIRSFRPQEQRPKAGDPALYLGLVQELSPTSV